MMKSVLMFLALSTAVICAGVVTVNESRARSCEKLMTPAKVAVIAGCAQDRDPWLVECVEAGRVFIRWPDGRWLQVVPKAPEAMMKEGDG